MSEAKSVPAIRLAGVRAGYDGRPALDDVTFDVREGTFTALIGPNGAGKSTCLKLLLGLVGPQAGRVEVFGEDAGSAARGIGYVPQSVEIPKGFPISVEEVAALQPQRIVISPGPGDPTGAGVSVPLIRRFAGEVPILGVCLGHQSLGYAFGGEIVRAKRIMHGKVSPVQHDDTGVHRDVPNPFEATRYHSLVIRKESLPERFRVVARTTDDDEIMAISDDAARLYGIQYHPESILTTEGMGILKNFLEMT